MSHEQILASGWDYYAAVAPRRTDTLNFLAHREKGGRQARKEIYFYFWGILNTDRKKAEAPKINTDAVKL